MKIDGGLRNIFRHKLRSWQWTTIETGPVSPGTPDSEFFSTEGVQGWIEYKKTDIYFVHFRDFQVPWIMRRARMGGNVWLAIRRTPHSIKEMNSDELWLIPGKYAYDVQEGGLNNPAVGAYIWNGGPDGWNFDDVALALNLKKSGL